MRYALPYRNSPKTTFPPINPVEFEYARECGFDLSRNSNKEFAKKGSIILSRLVNGEIVTGYTLSDSKITIRSRLGFDIPPLFRFLDLKEAVDFAEKTSTEKILTKLSGDTNENVRAVAAAHFLTSNETLEKLSCDTSAIVRQEVARNPNATEKILSKLIHDGSPTVAVMAIRAKNVKFPGNQ